MELARKIGIGIAMIIPAFVFGGVVWALIESWLAVLALEVIMVILYFRIITRRPSGSTVRA